MTPVLDQDLEALREAGGKLARCCAPSRTSAVVTGPPPEGPSQDVGRGHGILDCQVDADAADRRHGVRRIADAE